MIRKYTFPTKAAYREAWTYARQMDFNFSYCQDDNEIVIDDNQFGFDSWSLWRFEGLANGH